MIDATCLVCAQPYQARAKTSRYCSPTCARVYAKTLTDKTCTEPDCDKRLCARGLCSMHWKRKYGGPRKLVEYPCATCGEPTMKEANKRLPNRFCSWLCRDLWNIDNVKQGGAPGPRGPRAQRSCRIPASHPARWFGTSTAVKYGSCPECSQVFVGRPSGQTYCSAKCRKRATERRKGTGKLKRHKDRRLAIFERDQWTCWLCGGATSRTYSVNDLLSPTVDHLVPQSLGGTDEPSNLGTAHLTCNSSRGNSYRLTFPERSHVA